MNSSLTGNALPQLPDARLDYLWSGLPLLERVTGMVDGLMDLTAAARRAKRILIDFAMFRRAKRILIDFAMFH